MALSRPRFFNKYNTAAGLTGIATQDNNLLLLLVLKLAVAWISRSVSVDYITICYRSTKMKNCLWRDNIEDQRDFRVRPNWRKAP